MNFPQLDVDDLAVVIRKSMDAQQQPGSALSATPAQPDGASDKPPKLKLQPEFQPRTDDRYHLNDLLPYHDRVFVQAAYRAVLKRSPDQTESLRDLKRLRSGYVNKIDLLADLRFSPEGRAKGVRVDGLLVPALIRRLGQLPLIGYPIRLGVALLRLPKHVHAQREFAGYVLAQNQEIADFINLAVTERLNNLAHEQQSIAGEFKQQVETVRDEALALRVRLEDFSDPRLEPIYVALEDRFRGAREEIKERFREYLPYVKEKAPVIDLGCGRGEWLELLAENGVEARGVDSNSLQATQCRARGLEVSDQDLLVFLKGVADASAGAITGFHIVEHLSFNALVALLDEVMRVLRPGGVVIFETPNPENLVVGSNYFYLDPTHRHPLPTELMEFLFKHRGFEQIEILPLHAWESGRVAGDGELAERFNAYIYGPMDYAVVGRKVCAP
ncbi:MAG TPA: class I SAM-dependent methyltransferase [Pyrinomonadaceae bacterium]|nr:class I SAM-dependent methyltransferase [Pyrinomonadaceae bacterium]